jgi:hypothetical protein
MVRAAAPIIAVKEKATNLAPLALTAAVAFVVEVVVLMNLGRTEPTVADLTAWKASWQERQQDRYKEAPRRSSAPSPLGGYRGVG